MQDAQGIAVLMQQCYFEDKALIDYVETGGEPCDCMTQAAATTQIRACFGDCWHMARSAFCSVSAEHACAKAVEGRHAPVKVSSEAAHYDIRRSVPLDAVVEATAMPTAPTEVDPVAKMAVKCQRIHPGGGGDVGGGGTSRAFLYSRIFSDAEKDPSAKAVWHPGRIEVFVANRCDTEIEVSILGRDKGAHPDQ